MEIKIIGKSIPNIPWQNKPEGYPFPVWRYTENPITQWNPVGRASRIFNSAVIPKDGKFVGVFRADNRAILPQIHFGTSEDGIHWDINPDYIHWKDENGEEFVSAYGYDPRLVEIEGTNYITWCTDFGGGPTIAVAKTNDFKEYTRLDNAFLVPNRNGVLFPRKIGGKFYMLSRPSDYGHTPFGDIYISESPDMIYWGRHRKVMSNKAYGWWQDMKIGAGPIPIETNLGWLTFYHGVCNTCNGYVYSMGVAILDKDEPWKVLYRASDYLLTPEMPYEVSGMVPNVCFPCAALADADTGRIAIYYGAADTYTALAFTSVDEVCRFAIENSKLAPKDDETVK